MLHVLDPKHFHAGALHRLWLIVLALIAFAIAAFWAQPVG